MQSDVANSRVCAWPGQCAARPSRAPPPGEAPSLSGPPLCSIFQAEDCCTFVTALVPSLSPVSLWTEKILFRLSLRARCPRSLALAGAPPPHLYYRTTKELMSEGASAGMPSCFHQPSALLSQVLSGTRLLQEDRVSGLLLIRSADCGGATGKQQPRGML